LFSEAGWCEDASDAPLVAHEENRLILRMRTIRITVDVVVA
jgi:hypothetical protein